MKILMIGTGPDRIGKTSELDRFAVQALRFLGKEGHGIVWVDDNPATLASSRDLADRVYLEPLTLKVIEKIIEREKPDGIMYGFGGNLAAHLVIFLEREGVLDRFGVKVLGTKVPALKRFMDVEIFKGDLLKMGVPLMEAEVVDNVDECVEVAKSFGFPLILRPSFSLEGIGGYLTYNIEEVKNLARLALNLSPVEEILLERAPADWVQFAIEAVHDPKNMGIVYLVGTFEAIGGGVGVHPGNSVVIAPALTLKEGLLEKAMNFSALIAKSIEVCGNFQVRFALAPSKDEMVVLRVVHGLNRFSSLFSLLYSVPLGQINAALCLGSTIDEVGKKVDLGCFPWEEDEDLSIARIPIFPDEFARANILDSTMRSTGAAALLESNLSSALGKAMDFLAVSGFFKTVAPKEPELKLEYIEASADRLMELVQTLESGEKGVERKTPKGLNPAFFPLIMDTVSKAQGLRALAEDTVPHRLIEEAKAGGFSDRRIAQLTQLDENTMLEIRKKMGVHPRLAPVRSDLDPIRSGLSFFSYQQTANEPGETADSQEVPEAVLFLGPGPFRIGWGPEVDEALVKATLALKAQGKRLVLINNNPDAVSMDSGSIDCICLETPTLEVVNHTLDAWPIAGLIHQFCLDLPDGLESLLDEHELKVLGTPLRSLSTIRNVPLLWDTLKQIGVPLLCHTFASDMTTALSGAKNLAYPVLVRLTDEALNPLAEVIYEESSLLKFISLHQDRIRKEAPLFMEAYQEGMLGAGIIALCDGEESMTMAFLENIEEYGVHSGDCATTIPTLSIGDLIKFSAEDALKAIVKHFNIVGYLQIGFAIKGRNIYVTDVWPFPGRHLPLVEKATGFRIHEWAAQLMLGARIAELDVSTVSRPSKFYVKESTFLFSRFPGISPVLSPRMQSTGQVLGVDDSFGKAYFKSQMAVNPRLPIRGSVFLSARDTEKEAVYEVSKKLLGLGFSLVSTEGTAQFLANRGIEVSVIRKVSAGRPNILDLIINEEISLVINIPGGVRSKRDEESIYRAAIEHGVPLITTISGANLIVRGLEEIHKSPLSYVQVEM